MEGVDVDDEDLEWIEKSVCMEKEDDDDDDDEEEEEDRVDWGFVWRRRSVGKWFCGGK